MKRAADHDILTAHLWQSMTVAEKIKLMKKIMAGYPLESREREKIKQQIADLEKK